MHVLDRRPTRAAIALLLFLTMGDALAEAPAGDHRPARRIVTIAPNAAEIICELGACDRLVGVSKFCIHPPELKRRPKVGGLFDPDLEKIVVLRPDLVVLRGRSESIERLCASHDIALYHDKTDTIPGITRCVRDLGERLDRAEQADAVVERFRQRLGAVRRRTSDKPRPRVLLTVSRAPGKLANILTSAHGTFLDETIRIAGGSNAFAGIEMTYPQVSTESIVAVAPDVIIELMPAGPGSEEQLQRVKRDWQALATVPAVKNDAIHVITEKNALIPSPRYVAIIEKIAGLLHPDPGDDD